MERSVAINKLGRLLGKSMGYRIDLKAPTADERSAAQSELPAAVAIRNSISERKAARLSAILQADAEYQQLKADHEEARKRCDRLGSTTRHFKIMVGTSNDLFFHVRAQGDSWEDVISQLTAKQVA